MVCKLAGLPLSNVLVSRIRLACQEAINSRYLKGVKHSVLRFVQCFNFNKLEYVRLLCKVLILFISYACCFALSYSWQLLCLNSICEIHIGVIRRKIVVCMDVGVALEKMFLL